MKRKYIIWIIFIVLVGSITLRLYANKEVINEKSKPKLAGSITIPVTTDTVAMLPLTISIVKTGNLAPFKEAKVLLPIGGIIKSIRFELGDHVKASQILGVIDSHTKRLELDKAKTKEAKLKNDLQTYQELYAGKAATKEKVNEIQQNYDDAINEREQLLKEVDDASVRAGIDGIISSKSLEPGAFANAGAELATIVNLSTAKVQVSLTESEAYHVVEGQPVKITTNVYPDKVFTGKLTFISPQADATHNYAAEIVISNAEKTILRSGTFVYADFSTAVDEVVMLIPREALMQSVQQATVFVVDKDSRVALKQVKTHREAKGMIEITAGLKPGDIVVTTGQINLKDGTLVQITK